MKPGLMCRSPTHAELKQRKHDGFSYYHLLVTAITQDLFYITPCEQIIQSIPCKNESCIDVTALVEHQSGC